MSETIGNVSVSVRSPVDELQADFNQALALARRFAADFRTIIESAAPTGSAISQIFESSGVAAQAANDQIVRSTARGKAAIDQQRQSVSQLARDLTTLSRTDIQSRIDSVTNVSRSADFTNASQSARVFEREIRRLEDSANDALQRIRALSVEGSNITERQAPGLGQPNALQSQLDVTGVLGQRGAAAIESVAATEQQAEAEEQLASSIEALRASINPTIGAQERWNETLRTGAVALELGEISVDEYQRLVGLANIKLQAAEEHQRRFTQDLDGVTSASKLSSFQLTNLSFQLNDVVQGFAIGQRPMQIFAQQGFQIAQVLQQSQGGFGAGLRGVLQLLTPTRLAIGGVSTVLAAGVIAWKSYEGSIANVNRSLTTFGRRSGFSQTDVQNIAKNISDAGDLSTRAARNLAAEFIAAGAVSEEQILGLSENVRDFAITTDRSLQETQELFADLFRDPARISEQLAKEGVITFPQANDIQALVRTNDELEALDLLLSVLPERLLDAEENMSGLARAASATGRFFGNVADSTGEALDKFADFARQRQEAADTIGGAIPTLGITVRALQIFDRPTPVELPEAELQAQQEAAEAAFDLGRAQEAARSAEDTQRRQRIQTLEGETSKIREALDLGQLDLNQRRELTRALGELSEEQVAVSRARDTALLPSEKAVELANLELELAQETNPVLQAEIQQRTAVAQAAGEEVTAIEVATRARNAYQTSILGIITPSQVATREIIAEAEAIERFTENVRDSNMSLVDAQRQMEIELQLRPLLIAQIGAEQAIRNAGANATDEQRQTLEDITQAIGDQTAAMNDLNAANDRAAVASFVAQSTQDVQEQINLFGVQARTIGLTRRETIRLTRENDFLAAAARSVNLSVEEFVQQNSEAADVLRQQAQASAEAEEQLIRLEEAYQRTRESAQFFGNEVVDVFDRLFIQLDSVQEVAFSLVKTLASESLRAFLLGEGPIAAITPVANEQDRAIGGVLGRPLGGLFGLDRSAEETLGQEIGVTGAADGLLGAAGLGDAVPVRVVGGPADILGLGEEGINIPGAISDSIAGGDVANEATSAALNELGFAAESTSNILSDQLSTSTADAALQTIQTTVTKQAESTQALTASTSLIQLSVAANAASASLSAIAAQGSTGGVGSLISAVVPVGHTGGRSEALTGRRAVNPAIFMGAPRLHDGLAPNEFGAILERGEAVIPRNRVDQFERMAGSSEEDGVQTKNVANSSVFNFNFPPGTDAESFGESQSQILKNTATALQRIQQRNS